MSLTTFCLMGTMGFVAICILSYKLDNFRKNNP